MDTPDLSTLSDNIDSTEDLVPSLQVLNNPGTVLFNIID